MLAKMLGTNVVQPTANPNRVTLGTPIVTRMAPSDHPFIKITMIWKFDQDKGRGLLSICMQWDSIFERIA